MGSGRQREAGLWQHAHVGCPGRTFPLQVVRSRENVRSGPYSFSSSACATSWVHSVQCVLPRTWSWTGLSQPSVLQRLPPPCAKQWGVPA
jgi:hypothetical protein